jgi:predicted ATPase
MILQGHATTMQGNAEAGIHDLTTGFAAYRSIGATVWLPQALTYLATAHLELRNIDEASRLISEAINAVETSKETWFEAEVHRTAGEIALRASPPDTAKAELCFQRAIAVAQAQGAKSWELRSAMSLATLWGKQAQQEKAYELLQATYSWFSEGFDTKDLRETRALLGEMSATLRPT